MQKLNYISYENPSQKYLKVFLLIENLGEKNAKRANEKNFKDSLEFNSSQNKIHLKNSSAV